MKIQDYSFSPALRQDTNFLSVMDDLASVINNGRYQMRVVISVPTWVGEEGEHLLYISGTVRRFYFYDITNSTWQFIQWNSAGLGQSTIVATVQLTAQTANIGTTTIYTPATLGLFRVSVYQICSTAGAAGTLNTLISWTDGASAKSTSPAGDIALDSTNNGATGMTFISSGASAITHASTITGGAGSPKFDIYILLEALA